MKILVLNCGSSSIKYQLFDIDKNIELLALGLIERIGSNNSKLIHTPKGKDKYELEKVIPNHTVGVDSIFKILTDKKQGVIKEINEIKAVGHRIVHGGEKFSQSVLINPEVIKEIEGCVSLAPLHNPAHLKGIYAIKKLLPKIPQCAVFDTAFHQTMPDYAYMYALPYEMYDKYKVRRYGFHGTSHKFISIKAAECLKKDYAKLKMITCHLGNGASVAAIKDGKSVDTSMGLTPVEGLIMGTRCGDLDVGALLYVMDKEKLDLKSANELVNNRSGMLGISGISKDIRDITLSANQGHKRAQMALKMYAYRVKKYIGAYAAAMNGVDVIIFSAGVGENSSEIREEICKEMDFLGIELDRKKNNNLKSKVGEISKSSSKVKVLVIPTNEELVIAEETLNILKKR